MIDRKEMPKSWKVKKLGELCKQKEGLRRGPFGSAIRKEFFVPDGYKVYEQSNAIYDDIERGRYFIDENKYQELINFSVHPGDLIVSCSGTLGRIAEIPSNAKAGVINQALLRIRLLDDIISKKYFLYFFRSAAFQKKIFDQSQGTAMSNLIGIKDFKQIELSVPSLIEQQQIVSKIEELFSEVDKGIEEIKTAQQQLKVYRQALLKWAFEGKLTNQIGNWVYKTFKHCLKFSQGIQIDVGLQKNQMEEGCVRFLRIIDFTQGIDAARYIDDLGERYYVSKNEISLVRYGASTGFVCSGLDGVIANNLFKITPSEDIAKKYLFYFLNSSLFQNVIAQNVKGAAMPAISFGLINNVTLPIPSMEEQQRIVQEIESRLSVCDKIEETIKNSIKQAETLRESILKKAFEGKLV
jgi:type I restriction enzyme S subunit